MDLDRLRSDLADEHVALDAVVAGLDEEAWRAPSPAAGWDVADCISHLAFFDAAAVLALTDAQAFAAHAEQLMSGGRDAVPDVELGRSVPGPELLQRWRTGRASLLDAIAAATEADPTVRVPWYGPPMGLASFTTARLMETWAHGQDVVDALGAAPVVSDRLRHVCHIGVGARPYAYLVHGLDDPGDPVRVELRAPSGEMWAWGNEHAPDRITGSALDFALVATQRRHPDDTALTAEGSTARQWLTIIQAFAGGAGTGRPAGMRRLTQT